MAKNNETVSRGQSPVGSQQVAVCSVQCAVGSGQSAVCNEQVTGGSTRFILLWQAITDYCYGSLQTAHCPLRTAHCELPTANCLLLIAYCLLLNSCFQPESGCLDIEATNFNIAADEPCDSDNSASSCPCTYPTFSFSSTDYLFDKLDYEADTFYRVDDQYIRVVNIQFYLSDIEFRRTTGEWIGVADTISLGVLNEENQLESQILTDDFILVKGQSRIEIGDILQSGTFDSLRFLVGINGVANTVDPDSVSDNSHPLAESEMHLGNINDGYIFNQLVIHKDTLAGTMPTTLNISANIENGQVMTVQKLISAKSSVGTDFSVGTLTVNHAKWFDGIKFVTDTDAVMIEKIVANTPNVFSISN